MIDIESEKRKAQYRALIAAAPDMLETLRLIVANGRSIQYNSQWVVDIAKAAIARATKE